MKIFISSDIEGTAGIVDWKETELSERVGDYFRALDDPHLDGGASEVNADGGNG